MEPRSEIHTFLLQHLEAIRLNDLEMYHRTTAQELSLYEWWITPHRIDGLPFHDFMMEANARRGSVFGAETTTDSGDHLATRFDLSNLRIQEYGDAAIATYTLLISAAAAHGVTVSAHNESRVIVRTEEGLKVVHVHKSPAWNAPHTPPASAA